MDGLKLARHRSFVAKGFVRYVHLCAHLPLMQRVTMVKQPSAVKGVWGHVVWEHRAGRRTFMVLWHMVWTNSSSSNF